MHFDDIVRGNVQEVKNFLNRYVETRQPSNMDNLDVSCPFCDNGRHRFKMTINVGWGGRAYCYRCGKSIPLYNFCKLHNIHNEFLDLLSEISNTSLANITEVLNRKPTITEDNVEKHIVKQTDKAEEYIKEHKFLKVNEIKEAYEYALYRSFDNKELIKDWYCDNAYIYIPTVVDCKMNSLIGRLYMDMENLPRYNNKMIDRENILCYNYDNVVSNYALDTVYFTEGIFDTIAINHCLNGNHSIALLGKSHYKAIFDRLSKLLNPDTNIVICLDSIDKDKEIINNNLSIGKYVSKYFNNVFIVNLEKSDCFDICKTMGVNELQRQLKENRYSFAMYQVLFRL